MGRRSSGGGGGVFGGRSSAPAKSSSSSSRQAPPPAAQPQAPPPAAHAPQSGGGGLLSGLAGTVMQGMAFGGGSAIAHRAIDGVMGPRQVEHVNVPAAAPAPVAATSAQPASAFKGCTEEYSAFNQCVKESQGDMNSCKFQFEVYSMCQNNERANSQWK